MGATRWQDTPEWDEFMRNGMFEDPADRADARRAGRVAVAAYREQLRTQIEAMPAETMAGGMLTLGSDHWLPRAEVLGLLGSGDSA